MRNLQEFMDKLDDLDLGPIKVKIMHEDGLSRDEVIELEKEYKRFLTLIYLHPSRSIVPTTDIDRMWHAHILDTAKYAEDCDQLFGFFLHHFPYFGLRGDEDEQQLIDSFNETQRLYTTVFGEPYCKGEARMCTGTGGTPDFPDCTEFAENALKRQLRPNFV